MDKESQTNKLALNVRQLDLEGEDSDRSAGYYAPLGGATALDIELFLDGRRIGGRGFVDICRLWRGIYVDPDSRTKTNYLFNCGCGEPGCVGLDYGIDFSLQGEFVSWKFTREFADWAGFPVTSGEVILRFSGEELRQQYRRMWQEILRIGGNHPDQVRLPIYDYPLADIVRKHPELVPQ